MRRLAEHLEPTVLARAERRRRHGAERVFGKTRIVPTPVVSEARDMDAPRAVAQRDRDTATGVAVSVDGRVGRKRVLDGAVMLPRGPAAARAVLPGVPQTTVRAAAEQFEPAIVMP